MGDDAALQGSLRPGLVDHGAKRLQVRNWTAAADSFTWQIDVPRATEFEVVALTKSRGAVLELSCGGTKLERDVTTGWDRIAMGQLSVPSGVHSITLRAPRPGRRMEFYSLELTTPDLARTLEREARAAARTPHGCAA
jgi:hypothetical protein